MIFWFFLSICGTLVLFPELIYAGIGACLLYFNLTTSWITFELSIDERKISIGNISLSPFSISLLNFIDNFVPLRVSALSIELIVISIPKFNYILSSIGKCIRGERNLMESSYINKVIGDLKGKFALHSDAWRDRKAKEIWLQHVISIDVKGFSIDLEISHLNEWDISIPINQSISNKIMFADYYCHMVESFGSNRPQLVSTLHRLLDMAVSLVCITSTDPHIRIFYEKACECTERHIDKEVRNRVRSGHHVPPHVGVTINAGAGGNPGGAEFENRHECQCSCKSFGCGNSGVLSDRFVIGVHLDRFVLDSLCMVKWVEKSRDNCVPRIKNILVDSLCIYLDPVGDTRGHNTPFVANDHGTILFVKRAQTSVSIPDIFGVLLQPYGALCDTAMNENTAEASETVKNVIVHKLDASNIVILIHKEQFQTFVYTGLMKTIGIEAGNDAAHSFIAWKNAVNAEMVKHFYVSPTMSEVSRYLELKEQLKALDVQLNRLSVRIDDALDVDTEAKITSFPWLSAVFSRLNQFAGLVRGIGSIYFFSSYSELKESKALKLAEVLLLEERMPLEDILKLRAMANKWDFSLKIKALLSIVDEAAPLNASESEPSNFRTMLRSKLTSLKEIFLGKSNVESQTQSGDARNLNGNVIVPGVIDAFFSDRRVQYGIKALPKLQLQFEYDRRHCDLEDPDSVNFALMVEYLQLCGLLYEDQYTFIRTIDVLNVAYDGYSIMVYDETKTRNSADRMDATSSAAPTKLCPNSENECGKQWNFETYFELQYSITAGSACFSGIIALCKQDLFVYYSEPSLRLPPQYYRNLRLAPYMPGETLSSCDNCYYYNFKCGIVVDCGGVEAEVGSEVFSEEVRGIHAQRADKHVNRGKSTPVVGTIDDVLNAAASQAAGGPIFRTVLTPMSKGTSGVLENISGMKYGDSNGEFERNTWTTCLGEDIDASVVGASDSAPSQDMGSVLPSEATVPDNTPIKDHLSSIERNRICSQRRHLVVLCWVMKETTVVDERPVSRPLATQGIPTAAQDVGSSTPSVNTETILEQYSPPPLNRCIFEYKNKQKMVGIENCASQTTSQQEQGLDVEEDYNVRWGVSLLNNGEIDVEVGIGNAFICGEKIKSLLDAWLLVKASIFYVPPSTPEEAISLNREMLKVSVCKRLKIGNSLFNVHEGNNEWKPSIGAHVPTPEDIFAPYLILGGKLELSLEVTLHNVDILLIPDVESYSDAMDASDTTPSPSPMAQRQTTGTSKSSVITHIQTVDMEVLSVDVGVVYNCNHTSDCISCHVDKLHLFSSQLVVVDESLEGLEGMIETDGIDTRLHHVSLGEHLMKRCRAHAVPDLNTVPLRIAYPDGRSDYFLWSDMLTFVNCCGSVVRNSFVDSRLSLIVEEKLKSFAEIEEFASDSQEAVTVRRVFDSTTTVYNYRRGGYVAADKYDLHHPDDHEHNKEKILHMNNRASDSMFELWDLDICYKLHLKGSSYEVGSANDPKRALLAPHSALEDGIICVNNMSRNSPTTIKLLSTLSQMWETERNCAVYRVLVKAVIPFFKISSNSSDNSGWVHSIIGTGSTRDRSSSMYSGGAGEEDHESVSSTYLDEILNSIPVRAPVVRLHVDGKEEVHRLSSTMDVYDNHTVHAVTVFSEFLVYRHLDDSLKTPQKCGDRANASASGNGNKDVDIAIEVVDENGIEAYDGLSAFEYAEARATKYVPLRARECEQETRSVEYELDSGYLGVHNNVVPATVSVDFTSPSACLRIHCIQFFSHVSEASRGSIGDDFQLSNAASRPRKIHFKIIPFQMPGDEDLSVHYISCSHTILVHSAELHLVPVSVGASSNVEESTNNEVVFLVPCSIGKRQYLRLEVHEESYDAEEADLLIGECSIIFDGIVCSEEPTTFCNIGAAISPVNGDQDNIGKISYSINWNKLVVDSLVTSESTPLAASMKSEKDLKELDTLNSKARDCGKEVELDMNCKDVYEMPQLGKGMSESRDSWDGVVSEGGYSINMSDIASNPSLTSTAAESKFRHDTAAINGATNERHGETRVHVEPVLAISLFLSSVEINLDKYSVCELIRCINAVSKSFQNASAPLVAAESPGALQSSQSPVPHKVNSSNPFPLSAVHFPPCRGEIVGRCGDYNRNVVSDEVLGNYSSISALIRSGKSSDVLKCMSRFWERMCCAVGIREAEQENYELLFGNLYEVQHYGDSLLLHGHNSKRLQLCMVKAFQSYYFAADCWKYFVIPWLYQLNVPCNIQNKSAGAYRTMKCPVGLKTKVFIDSNMVIVDMSHEIEHMHFSGIRTCNADKVCPTTLNLLKFDVIIPHRRHSDSYMGEEDAALDEEGCVVYVCIDERVWSSSKGMLKWMRTMGLKKTKYQIVSSNANVFSLFAVEIFLKNSQSYSQSSGIPLTPSTEKTRKSRQTQQNSTLSSIFGALQGDSRRKKLSGADRNSVSNPSVDNVVSVTLGGLGVLSSKTPAQNYFVLVGSLSEYRKLGNGQAERDRSRSTAASTASSPHWILTERNVMHLASTLAETGDEARVHIERSSSHSPAVQNLSPFAVLGPCDYSSTASNPNDTLEFDSDESLSDFEIESVSDCTETSVEEYGVDGAAFDRDVSGGSEFNASSSTHSSQRVSSKSLFAVDCCTTTITTVEKLTVSIAVEVDSFVVNYCQRSGKSLGAARTSATVAKELKRNSVFDSDEQLIDFSSMADRKIILCVALGTVTNSSALSWVQPPQIVERTEMYNMENAASTIIYSRSQDVEHSLLLRLLGDRNVDVWTRLSGMVAVSYRGCADANDPPQLQSDELTPCLEPFRIQLGFTKLQNEKLVNVQYEHVDHMTLDVCQPLLKALLLTAAEVPEAVAVGEGLVEPIVATIISTETVSHYGNGNSSFFSPQWTPASALSGRSVSSTAAGRDFFGFGYDMSPSPIGRLNRRISYSPTLRFSPVGSSPGDHAVLSGSGLPHLHHCTYSPVLESASLPNSSYVTSQKQSRVPPTSGTGATGDYEEDGYMLSTITFENKLGCVVLLTLHDVPTCKVITLANGNTHVPEGAGVVHKANAKGHCKFKSTPINEMLHKQYHAFDDTSVQNKLRSHIRGRKKRLNSYVVLQVNEKVAIVYKTCVLTPKVPSLDSSEKTKSHLKSLSKRIYESVYLSVTVAGGWRPIEFIRISACKSRYHPLERSTDHYGVNDLEHEYENANFVDANFDDRKTAYALQTNVDYTPYIQNSQEFGTGCDGAASCWRNDYILNVTIASNIKLTNSTGSKLFLYANEHEDEMYGDEYRDSLQDRYSYDLSAPPMTPMPMLNKNAIPSNAKLTPIRAAPKGRKASESIVSVPVGASHFVPFSALIEERLSYEVMVPHHSEALIKGGPKAGFTPVPGGKAGPRKTPGKPGGDRAQESSMKNEYIGCSIDVKDKLFDVGVVSSLRRTTQLEVHSIILKLDEVVVIDSAEYGDGYDPNGDTVGHMDGGRNCGSVGNPLKSRLRRTADMHAKKCNVFVDEAEFGKCSQDDEDWDLLHKEDQGTHAGGGATQGAAGMDMSSKILVGKWTLVFLPAVTFRNALPVSIIVDIVQRPVVDEVDDCCTPISGARQIDSTTPRQNMAQTPKDAAVSNVLFRDDALPLFFLPDEILSKSHEQHSSGDNERHAIDAEAVFEDGNTCVKDHSWVPFSSVLVGDGKRKHNASMYSRMVILPGHEDQLPILLTDRNLHYRIRIPNGKQGPADNGFWSNSVVVSSDLYDSRVKFNKSGSKPQLFSWRFGVDCKMPPCDHQQLPQIYHQNHWYSTDRQGDYRIGRLIEFYSNYWIVNKSGLDLQYASSAHEYYTVGNQKDAESARGASAVSLKSISKAAKVATQRLGKAVGNVMDSSKSKTASQDHEDYYSNYYKHPDMNSYTSEVHVGDPAEDRIGVDFCTWPTRQNDIIEYVSNAEVSDMGYKSLMRDGNVPVMLACPLQKLQMLPHNVKPISKSCPMDQRKSYQRTDSRATSTPVHGPSTPLPVDSMDRDENERRDAFYVYDMRICDGSYGSLSHRYYPVVKGLHEDCSLYTDDDWIRVAKYPSVFEGKRSSGDSLIIQTQNADCRSDSSNLNFFSFKCTRDCFVYVCIDAARKSPTGWMIRLGFQSISSKLLCKNSVCSYQVFRKFYCKHSWVQLGGNGCEHSTATTEFQFQSDSPANSTENQAQRPNRSNISSRSGSINMYGIIVSVASACEREACIGHLRVGSLLSLRRNILGRQISDYKTISNLKAPCSIYADNCENLGSKRCIIDMLPERLRLVPGLLGIQTHSTDIYRYQDQPNGLSSTVRKLSATKAYMQFQVLSESYVIVCIDKSLENIPVWLPESGFQQTSMKLFANSFTVEFVLWCKYFPSHSNVKIGGIGDIVQSLKLYDCQNIFVIVADAMNVRNNQPSMVAPSRPKVIQSENTYKHRNLCNHSISMPYAANYSPVHVKEPESVGTTCKERVQVTPLPLYGPRVDQTSTADGRKRPWDEPNPSDDIELITLFDLDKEELDISSHFKSARLDQWGVDSGSEGWKSDGMRLKNLAPDFDSFGRQYSKPFRLTVGNSGELSMSSATVAVSITQLPGVFHKTSVVTLAPRYVVCNQLPFDVEIFPFSGKDEFDFLELVHLVPNESSRSALVGQNEHCVVYNFPPAGTRTRTSLDNKGQGADRKQVNTGIIKSFIGGSNGNAAHRRCLVLRWAGEGKSDDSSIFNRFSKRICVDSVGTQYVWLRPPPSGVARNIVSTVAPVIVCATIMLENGTIYIRLTNASFNPPFRLENWSPFVTLYVKQQEDTSVVDSENHKPLSGANRDYFFIPLKGGKIVLDDSSAVNCPSENSPDASSCPSDSPDALNYPSDSPDALDGWVEVPPLSWTSFVWSENFAAFPKLLVSVKIPYRSHLCPNATILTAPTPYTIDKIGKLEMLSWSFRKVSWVHDRNHYNMRRNRNRLQGAKIPDSHLPSFTRMNRYSSKWKSWSDSHAGGGGAKRPLSDHSEIRGSMGVHVVARNGIRVVVFQEIPFESKFYERIDVSNYRSVGYTGYGNQAQEASEKSIAVKSSVTGDVQSLLLKLLHSRVKLMGISLYLKDVERDVLALSVEGINLIYSGSLAWCEFSVSHVQMDDLREEARFPCILIPTFSVGAEPNPKWKVSDSPSANDSESAECCFRYSCTFDKSYVQSSSFEGNTKVRDRSIFDLAQLRQVRIHMAEMTIRVDAEMLLCVMDIASSILSVVTVDKHAENREDGFLLRRASLNAALAAVTYEITTDVLPFITSQNSQSSSDKMIYMESFYHSALVFNTEIFVGKEILAMVGSHKMDLTIAAGFAILGGPLVSYLSHVLLSIAHISPVFVFQKTDLSHYFGSSQVLGKKLVNKLTQQAVLQVSYKVFGSLELLGNPLSLLDDINTGVVDFISMTTMEMTGQKEFRLDGVKSLLMSLTHGASSVLSRQFGSVADVIKTATDSGVVDSAGHRTILGLWRQSIIAGWKSLTALPLELYDEYGFVGYIYGVTKGSFQILSITTSGVFETVSIAAEKLENYSVKGRNRLNGEAAGSGLLLEQHKRRVYGRRSLLQK